MYLLNQDNARVSSGNYWTMSPVYFNDFQAGVFGYNASGRSINLGNTGTYYTDNSYGIRPSIALVAGLKYASGDGSTTTPYIVDYTSLNNP